MKRFGYVAGMIFVAGAAHAGGVPRYEAAPDWIKLAPAIDATKLDGDSPILLRADNQQRLEAGEVWSYNDVATRLATPEVVTQAGTLSIPWQPSKGDLIVHQLEIIRGAERINVLAAGKTFTVIRREQQLEKRAIDGQLTATMAVQGLRVGDVLHLVVSVTNREQVLQGELQTAMAMPVAPLKVGFSRVRVLWPANVDMHWKSYAKDPDTAGTVEKGYRQLVVTGPLPKESELPGDAPMRYHVLPIVEASTFADWNAVSRVMAPLYATHGLIAPGSPLAEEVATIRAAQPDPLKRAASALQLVQEKVAYLYNGLENGNYVPQKPADTWSMRYGDCKAKTLLLLTILHELGIEAEPVLASSNLGDLLPKRLPSAGAFDHVFVKAGIGGRVYWLDGTASGARYADIGDTPPLRWVLPINAAGAELMSVPMRAPAAPTVSIAVDYDQRAGVTMPTLVHMVMHLRGPLAAYVGLAKTQGSKEQKDQMVTGLFGRVADGDVSLSEYTLRYDEAEADAVVDATALTTTMWSRVNNRRKLQLDRMVSQLTFEPDRTRPAWQSIPVATVAPDRIAITSRVLLPADVKGWTLEGSASVPSPLAGLVVERQALIAGNIVKMSDQAAWSGEEIAPADVTATRAKVALAKQKTLQVVAPVNLPAGYETVIAGRSDGRFKSLVNAYGKVITADPDDASGYVNRANFLIGIYDWRGALPDLDRAVKLDPSIDNLLRRAAIQHILGNEAAAAADYKSALKLDPTSIGALAGSGQDDVRHGRRDAAIARVQERIDAGGEGRSDLLALKADLLVQAHEGPAAIAAIDEANMAKPGNPYLLNARCWNKAKLDTALDSALKDCTKSIELGDTPINALDSRALVYLRRNQLDDALADLKAVLDLYPDQAGSLYLRAVIRSRQGDIAGAKADLAAVRLMMPTLEDEYKAFGIVPTGV